jgi:hypothetical protein
MKAYVCFACAAEYGKHLNRRRAAADNRDVFAREVETVGPLRGVHEHALERLATRQRGEPRLTEQSAGPDDESRRPRAAVGGADRPLLTFVIPQRRT